MVSATTAIPRGVDTTSTTPFTAFALAASNDFNVAPNSGGWIITAVSMPGSFTSIVNCSRPVDFSRLSIRGRSALPMSFQSFGSFRGTSLGTGTAAAAPITSPKPARRPEARCVSTPFSMVISAFGTFQVLDAAAINISRAAAPAWR